jgi:phage repressor protein C with HTH and peptisase S24 domain
MPEPRMDIAQRLKAAREAAGKTQRQVAEIASVEQSTYAHWEGGIKARPSPEKVDIIARALGVSAEWILFGRGEGPQKKKSPDSPAQPSPGPAPPLGGPLQTVPIDPHRLSIKDLPVYGSARGGVEGELIDYQDPVEFNFRPPELVGVRDAFGVYVLGDSMLERFRQGEIVWVHPGRRPNRGDDVVIVFHDHTALIKRLVSTNDGHVEVEQLNPRQKIKLPRDKIFRIFRIIGSIAAGN